MAKDKDPAFLFYSKDWLQGTSSLTPAEKGVYIDLLANQHQNKDLPNETKRLARMAGMSETEFLPIWDALKGKFAVTESNRLVNQRLTKVVTERSTGSLRNTIAGIFASIVRRSTEPPEIKEKMKKLFKVDDFITIPTDLLTERLTTWWANGTKSIGTGNANEGGNGINKEGSGKPSEERPEVNHRIAPRIVTIHKKHNPNYLINHTDDLPAATKIAYFLFDQKKLPGEMTEHAEDIVAAWEGISQFVATEKFYCQKGLRTIANNIQELTNKALYGDKSTKSINGQKQAGLSDDKLKAEIVSMYR